jgi:hypothetical protein
VGIAALFPVLGSFSEVSAQELNTLTPAQRDSGWVLLFDGKKTTGWHKQNETVTASTWTVNDNAIYKSGSGNLYSPVVAESFELSIDWKLANENGNSGVWMRILEPLNHDIQRSGPEIQIVGNLHLNYSQDRKTVGSCYAMYHPNPTPEHWVKPAGQWNNYRVIMDGKHVEHWGNGVKMVEYEIGSADWIARQNQAESRLKNPLYGELHYGYIVLTDHSAPVWYRNIRIRPLAGKEIRSGFPGYEVPVSAVRPGRLRIAPRGNVLSREGGLVPGLRITALDGRTWVKPAGMAERTAAGLYVIPGIAGKASPGLTVP